MGNRPGYKLKEGVRWGQYPALNIVRKRLADGSYEHYCYHRRARRRLFSKPGTAAFDAEYELAERGAPPPMRRGPTWVYFIRACELGLIKIGRATNVTTRFRALCASSPDALVLMGRVYDPSGGALEQVLHERFAAHRIRGEWFMAAPELLAHIEEVCPD